MRTSYIQRTLRALVVSCGAVASACGGGNGDSRPTVTTTPSSTTPSDRVVPQSDQEIATLVYNDGQRTPTGFYADSEPPVSSYATTSHLKNTDMPGAAADAAPHELCTDDWNEALDWSETVAAGADTYADLVATDSNSRFFEFGRVPRGQPGTYVRARVYKCEYLDRRSVNLLAATGAAGQLNRRPLTQDDLRELSEYLWLFTRYNNFGSAVLRSGADAGTPVAISHTLHVATLTRAPLTGGCDRFEVIAWTHTAAVPGGALQLTQQTLWTFGARQVGTSAQLCAL